METQIKVVCAWCEKFMGVKEGKGVHGVSHGMCDECLKKWEAEVEADKDIRNSEFYGANFKDKITNY